MTTPSDSIQWQAWGTEPFRRAAAESKPVLLTLGPAWCEGTAQLQRVGYRDPAVVDLVRDRFVPILVDVDRRPDVSERYTLGGWPTTACLTPTGEVLGGGVYLEPGRLAVVLAQVAEAFDRRRDELSVTRPEPASLLESRGAPAELDETAADWLVTELLSGFDDEWAGFGDAPKRVHADALAAGLALGPDSIRPSELRSVVERTLDAIADGALWDRVEGGAFRVCDGRDWSVPHVEKVLADNARLLELFLSASRRLDRPDFAERAAELVRFVHRTFADPEGGFYASQRADPGYSALTDLEARQRRDPPPVDRTIFTDGTALMAAAYVQGARVLDDDSLLEFAATSIDRVVLATYERGAGVGHQATGTPAARGLLTDQVGASEALLDLYEATGQDAYLDMPRELMAYCLQTMWSEGGFADRAREGLAGADQPVGLLREPHYPLGLTCRAAVVLARLGRLTGESAYADQARAALGTQTRRYRDHRLDGAAYPLALARLRAAERAG